MRALLLALALAVAAPAFAQDPAGQETDYLKRAGNFLSNCDPRADGDGNRPEPNYLCLSFMAGLIEGYTTAAVAAGNKTPYCLPRPVTLVEMMDMMAVAIERGAPPDLPTATVFHFLLEANFSCESVDAAEPASPAGPAE